MTTNAQRATLPDMIETVKAKLGGLSSIPIAYADRLLAILDRADKETLETIAAEKIRFIWIPAIHRLMDKHGYTWEKGLLLSNTSVR